MVKQFGLSEERGVLWAPPKILIRQSTEQILNFLDARTQIKQNLVACSLEMNSQEILNIMLLVVVILIVLLCVCVCMFFKYIAGESNNYTEIFSV